ncbi:MAG: hypothetical protein RBT62_04255 [Spirochaetia bacterium]|jgi:hypothetical protein|nr:hypothetical protein [Spirochaetia bacterium]
MTTTSEHAAHDPDMASTKARCRLGAKPGPEVFDAYDTFIRSIPFLSSRQSSALIVAGDEILDNLLTHGEIGTQGVVVLVRRRPRTLTLGFFVEAHREFTEFAAYIERCLHYEPRFDSVSRRWRGLGLSMCRNIAASIHYRPGHLVDRIFLTFDRDA